MTRKVAALFVAKGGAYFGVDGVDPWDEEWKREPPGGRVLIMRAK